MGNAVFAFLVGFLIWPMLFLAAWALNKIEEKRV